MTGKTWLLVLLAFVFAFASAPDVRAGSCVLCADAKKVACPTCAGRGRGLVPCDVCDGKGRVACRQKGDYAGPRLQAMIAALNGHDGVERECPNGYCIQGKIRWESGKVNTCRLCGGSGKIRCADCQAAATPCAACGGKGKCEGRCLDCAGTGFLACLHCARQAACPQCADARGLQCPTCAGEKTALQACETCGARGTERCEKCFGVGRAACADCDASGRSRMKYEDGTAASSMHCSACDGKGASTCAACKGAGRIKCSVCAGAKRVVQKCRPCGGGGVVDCSACDCFGYRALELLGSVAAKPDASGKTTPESREAATSLYERAVERARKFLEWAKDATDKAASKLGSLPEAPAAGASVEERRAYRERVSATFEARRAPISELIGAWPYVGRAQEALTRCEKALAALRASAPPK